MQAAILQVPQEAAPAFQILLLTLSDAQDLPESVGADADRHQHRDVANLARPAALQDHAVQIQIRELAFDRAIAPGFDVPVDLLVQPRHRPGAHSCAPQRLGDVFDSSHRHSRQVHLDQCFLDRCLAPLVALDDCRLERQPPQLRYLQRVTSPAFVSNLRS